MMCSFFLGYAALPAAGFGLTPWRSGVMRVFVARRF